MKQSIIGICGAEGAGKSTVAGILRRAGYAVHPFAAPLKSMLRALGVPKENLYGTPEEKEEPLPLLCGLSARKAMQFLGTEWGRQCIGPEIWVNAWEESIPMHSVRVVADDVRFENEAELIRQLGGTIVRVDRPSAYRDIVHASENYLAIRPDIIIRNAGSFDELERDVSLLCLGQNVVLA